MAKTHKAACAKCKKESEFVPETDGPNLWLCPNCGHTNEGKKPAKKKG